MKVMYYQVSVESPFIDVSHIVIIMTGSHMIDTMNFRVVVMSADFSLTKSMSELMILNIAVAVNEYSTADIMYAIIAKEFHLHLVLQLGHSNLLPLVSSF